MQQELAKAYEPKEVEAKWYAYWLEKKLFRPSGRKPYCIVIPPPNVTGALHMGHALNTTLQDILVRWRRMCGDAVLWQPGTDHAGIATQNVVEREILTREGKTRHDLGREKLIGKIWEWKGQYGDRILKQLQAMGASCDWSRTRFTLDEGLSQAVRECFVQLYRKKLIYRGNYIVNWCPRCRTALADDEVEHGEKRGSLWYIKYPSLNPKIKNQKSKFQHLIVATTRPETMLGDAAVAVNPKDKRYKLWIGKTLVLPEVGREIPVISDPFVDPKFGTGCVKVTPAHDPNDFQMGLRHSLPQINVMNADATMNENVSEKYRGMKREVCRKHLVENLQAAGLIEKVEEHSHSVGHCYRCNTVIEPWLSEQWFVKMKPLAAKAIAATKKGKVKFFPKRWGKFYLSWLENVRDWCISRQIWWGHRIPVWYCENSKIKNEKSKMGCGPIVAKEKPAKCPKCGGTNLKQDEDVLDTWFSSGLWPFSSLGWPSKTKTLAKFYPNNVLITDRGIIFFWVARMVMMGLELMKKEPFRHVYIHGTILDKQGQKMSKSRPETCIDPIDIIEKYGADALRFSLALLATEGQDIKLDESKFETGKHFCNKLWNATRFALMNLKDYDGKPDQEENLSLADKWIWNRLQHTVVSMNGDLENYQYFDAAQKLYRFIWNEFCDWYLELIKPTVASSHATQWNLRRVLDTILRLSHPFIPFITEALWQSLGKQEMSIVAAKYPVYPTQRVVPFQRVADNMESHFQTAVVAIRNFRGENKIDPRKRFSIFIGCHTDKKKKILEAYTASLKNLAVLSDVKFVTPEELPDKAARLPISHGEIRIPFHDLVEDVTQEKNRMSKEIKKMESEIQFFESKLANKNFVENAPKAVVEKERVRLIEHREKLGKLQAALEQLS